MYYCFSLYYFVSLVNRFTNFLVGSGGGGFGLQNRKAIAMNEYEIISDI